MGKLIYIMGPSGAGKDTLINKISALQRNDLRVARRFITRPLNPGDTEKPISVTTPEFLFLLQHDHFALAWQAHGFWYGISREIDHWLRQDKHVIVNGSREYLTSAQEKYQQIQPVYFSIDTEAQRQRLAARNREDKTAINERIQRSILLEKSMPSNCLFINSQQPLENMLADFIELLTALETV